MKNYPNEKREDFIDEDYYIYGMQCLNCREVNHFIVDKKSMEYNDFQMAKMKFHSEDEFKDCEECGLITRQRLLTLTPPDEN